MAAHQGRARLYLCHFGLRWLVTSHLHGFQDGGPYSLVGFPVEHGALTNICMNFKPHCSSVGPLTRTRSICPWRIPPFFFFFKENTLQFPRMLTFHVMQLRGFVLKAQHFYMRVWPRFSCRGEK